jgi:lipoprotein-anchoring transpeptidase ErfK/SrfK
MSDRLAMVASLVLLVGAVAALAWVLSLDPASSGPAEAQTVVWRQAGVPGGGSGGTAPEKGGRATGGGAARAAKSEVAAGPSFAVADLRPGARVRVYASPGRNGTAVGPKTQFGSPVAFAVMRRRGPWLGVATPSAPNGRLGWIRRDPRRLELTRTRYSLAVDLSRHRLRVRYGDSVLRSFTVTVGGPGTETPVGRYGVTDRLLFSDASGPYGCCALALNGHQTRLPEDWPGGDRLAIHGTTGPVGGAESHGCIRADERAMRFLIARIPLGTPVFVTD